MNRSIRVTAGFALLAFLSFAAPASAQDPARVAPQIYKVRLNNPWVRVLEVTGKAGQKARMHAHPDYVVYEFVDGRVKFTDPKGVSTEADLKAGETTWRGAERHASEVLMDIHGLLFELKGPKRATSARAARGDDPASVDPDHYKVLLDNDRVRVLEFRAASGAKSPMHSHPNYITYNFNGSKTKFTYPRGRRPVEVTSKADDVVWHRAETHAGQITGKTDAHVLIVEIK
jgi:quercetin dioxygenase-like cupin family protein